MASAELNVAVEAAKAGGEVVARYFREGVTVRSKESYNLVSDADIQSEEAIGRVIRKAFPEHAILGEESFKEDAGAEHLWVVDPLDGTNNFAHGIPHFAVSIAYCRKGKPECGVVFNPVRDEWYTAVRGEGAFAGPERLEVAGSRELTEVLVAVGFYYDRGRMMEATLRAIGDLFRRHVHGIRRFGTASLDLCQVAQGRFGAFFEYMLAPWDFAAGVLIVSEAGGRISTCRGETLPLEKSSLLATNGHVHQQVLEVVQPHLPDEL